MICLWICQFEGDGSMRDGENQRNEGDAFNPALPDQLDQSAPNQPAPPYLKLGGFCGFNSGSRLGFFKPIGLKSGG